MHHVVVGALISADRILLGHRSPSRRWYPDVWDLPGGHVEPGESQTDALTREIREELGVQVVLHDPVPFRVVDLPEAPGSDAIRMTFWRVRRWHGTPVNQCPDEHDELGWFSVAELGGLALAHPSYPSMLRALLGAASPGGRRVGPRALADRDRGGLPAIGVEHRRDVVGGEPS